MAVLGLWGTGEFTSAQRPQDWRAMTLRLDPNGDAPLIALSSMMKSQVTTDPVYNWMYKGFAARVLTVDGAQTSGTTAVEVVDGANFCRLGALLLNPRTNEVVRVTSDPATDVDLVLTRGFAGTTAAAMVDGDQLTIIGSAHAEGSGSGSGVGRVPIDASNFTQIFKTPFEITNTANATETRTEDQLKELQMENLGWHMQDIERAILFGVKSSSTGANGKLLRTTGGLKAFMTTNVQDYGGAATLEDLDNFYKILFKYGKAERIAFVGNEFISKLNRLVAANAQYTFGDTIKVYGMKLKEFHTPYGTAYYRRHPLITLDPYYNNSAWHVSPENMVYRFLKGRDTKLEENIQDNDEDMIKHQFLTECGFEFHFEETFGLITNL